ncbi:MAG: peptide-methionine (R)-S-oxide reductase MsrB [Nanoarchaeota archaeon]
MLMDKNINWKKKLTPEQYRVLRDKGTERAFTGELLHEKRKGMFVCAGCGAELFDSSTKFDSGTGWPSFYDAKKGSVFFHEDNSLGMKRVEVTCAKCGGHLGHVFDDGPSKTTGKRFCINSCALGFKGKNIKTKEIRK